MRVAGPIVVALLLLPGVVARAGAQSPAPASGATTDEHTGHGQPAPEPPASPVAQPDGGKHDSAQTGAPSQALPAFIPALTAADRKAAFPDVRGHTVHDTAVHSFVLFDQLEWQGGGKGGLSWDNKSWVGTDLDRLWVRSEGETDGRRIEHAELHLLYGRAFARWWEVVGGVRQDFRPGPQQTWAAVGIQGLAPQWFEVEATAYIGEGGQTAARLEAEYELLLTNRLVLQPLVEVDVYGKSNAPRAIGAGLSTAAGGFRMRYEIRRELAPYVGVTWQRGFGKTADFARTAGEAVQGARLVAGARVWF